MRLVIVYGFLLLVVGSCTNQPAKTDAAASFATYTFSGDDESETITGVFRFYNTPDDAEAIALETPAQLLFDGVPVTADSAGFGGAFYEVQTPRDAFAGTHIIELKDGAGTAYRDTFSFQPPALAADFPETLSGTELPLNVTGVADGETLRVLVTDTSFASPDINEEVLVQGGAVVLRAPVLQNIVAGPVVLQVLLEVERPLSHAPGGGQFSLTYGLSRAFTWVP